MLSPPLSPRTGGAPLPRLATPPRRVPLTLTVRLLFGGLGVFAWTWFGLGSSVATGFLRQADLTSWVLLQGALETAPGRVLGCQPTGASEGGGKGRAGTPVYANRYTFEAEGEAQAGVSYHTGRCVQAGEEVLVEYPQGRPDRSRIRGMRRAWFGPAVLFVALFPLVGLGLVGYSLRAGLRQRRLLAQGRMVLGTLVANEATGVTINHRRVRKLRFAIQTEASGRREVVVRSHLPEKALDDPQERILYDPDRPALAAAWDLLPGVRLDGLGELEPVGAVGALLLLVPPGLAVAGHLLALGLIRW